MRNYSIIQLSDFTNKKIPYSRFYANYLTNELNKRHELHYGKHMPYLKEKLLMDSMGHFLSPLDVVQQKIMFEFFNLTKITGGFVGVLEDELLSNIKTSIDTFNLSYLRQIKEQENTLIPKQFIERVNLDQTVIFPIKIPLVVKKQELYEEPPLKIHWGGGRIGSFRKSRF